MTTTKQRPRTPATKRARPGVRSEVMTVTPELASDWLGRNMHNRTLRNRTVELLADAIRRGEWVLNGDAIRFAHDGTLLDGQHRLWAIVEADTPVQTLVVQGLPTEAQETMDTGARRNLKDALTLRGYPDAYKRAAFYNYLHRYEVGAIRNASATPTIAQAMALAEAHPNIDTAIRYGSAMNRRWRVSAAVAGVAYYTFQTVDAELAEEFYSSILAGANLGENDPRLVLRRYFEAQATMAVGARAQALQHHALLIKAWNAWIEGREVEKLNWKAVGMKAEEFPAVHAPEA